MARVGQRFNKDNTTHVHHTTKITRLKIFLFIFAVMLSFLFSLVSATTQTNSIVPCSGENESTMAVTNIEETGSANMMRSVILVNQPVPYKYIIPTLFFLFINIIVVISYLRRY